MQALANGLGVFRVVRIAAFLGQHLVGNAARKSRTIAARSARAPSTSS